ncbi:hypothetical protein TKK_0003612 [Trichogramma kaykai]
MEKIFLQIQTTTLARSKKIIFKEIILNSSVEEIRNNYRQHMKQISDQLKTKEDYNKDFDILLKKSQELFVLRQNLDEKNIAACFDFEEKLRSVVQSTFDKKWGPHKVYLIILRYIILGAQLNLKKEDPTITLDLHYFSWLEAREILKKFLTFHRARESKRVTVVTGQGKRTGGGILRERSPELIEKERMRWSTSKTNPGRLEVTCS